MSANFTGYNAIWSFWQIHSTGAALQKHLPGMVKSALSGKAGGVNFNTSHLETLYNMVRNAANQVEDVLSKTNRPDMKRLTVAIKGESAADYFDEIKDWRNATNSLVTMIEGKYPRTEDPTDQFPETPIDLKSAELTALHGKLVDIQTAGD